MESHLAPPDPDEGGEAACWMHLLDDLEPPPTSEPAPRAEVDERFESADQRPSG